MAPLLHFARRQDMVGWLLAPVDGDRKETRRTGSSQ
jgi:hypothetical protein